MQWRRNLRLSLHALGRAHGRTLLSASGLGVGIAAVVLLFGVGEGAERAFTAALEEMGENLLAVGAERSAAGALRGASRQVETLTLADWRAIAEEVGVERAAPIALRDVGLRYGGRSLSATAIGTTPEFRRVKNQQLAAGRFLDAADVEEHARVAVIGAQVVRELFGGEHPLGERLQVGGTPFVVVGVLREKGVDPTGADEDSRILVPVSTAQRRLLDTDYVDRIFVQAESQDALGAVGDRVRALLRERHGLDASAADDFTLRTQAALLAALEDTDSSFARLLAGLAALTLCLASTGLLAVSLLSVRERHGEIGLRLAVGARPRHVLGQFLAETMMIAGLGAVAGLLAGGCGIILGERLIGWRLAMSWEAAAYPFALSFALAVAAGAYPALRAARLDPIVALRSQ